MENRLQGCELHRLGQLGEYDNDRFNHFYQHIKPLIKRLSNQVDSRRYQVSPEIIESYFWDKFLMVFMKYHKTYEDDRLNAVLISSLSTYKCRLLRSAYSKQSELYQQTCSLDGLLELGSGLPTLNRFNTDVEDISVLELEEQQYEVVTKYMANNLSADEYILFKTELVLPPFLEELIKSKGKSKPDINDLILYFELPDDPNSVKLINSMRENIQKALRGLKKKIKRGTVHI